jgi:hypothetical protein
VKIKNPTLIYMSYFVGKRKQNVDTLLYSLRGATKWADIYFFAVLVRGYVQMGVSQHTCTYRHITHPDKKISPWGWTGKYLASYLSASLRYVGDTCPLNGIYLFDDVSFWNRSCVTANEFSSTLNFQGFDVS